jgi:hypothetical protein
MLLTHTLLAAAANGHRRRRCVGMRFTGARSTVAPFASQYCSKSIRLSSREIDLPWPATPADSPVPEQYSKK